MSSTKLHVGIVRGEIVLGEFGRQQHLHNRIDDYSRIGIELQYIVQNLKVNYNYISGRVAGDNGGNMAAIENAGLGNNVHDNYVRTFGQGIIWANTAISAESPWYVTNNTFVDVKSFGYREGPFGPDVTPTQSGNTFHTSNENIAIPAWPYSVGVQSNIP